MRAIVTYESTEHTDILFGELTRNPYSNLAQSVTRLSQTSLALDLDPVSGKVLSASGSFRALCGAASISPGGDLIAVTIQLEL